jgi:VIT1/CCC1 family predicted Fe2+/Mn2+ transporter
MSITRRIDEARKAFEKRDLAASAVAHSPEAIAQAAEAHGGASHQYIGDIVYGGLDGIVTTFAVVSGVAGAGLGASIILILGLANLLADGLSMAAGAYLSLKSEREYYDREREREAWEVEHYPDGEKAEMLALFALGAAKVLITQRSWFRSGLEMLVVGGIAAGVAYLVGYLLAGLAQ